ncbi:MAG: adenosylcobinamide-GDP ribazoletransferase [Burkholderiaceae bacterium]
MIGRALRHYLLAVQFFTRLPVTGRLARWVGFSDAALRASAAHFPGVGWLIGAIAALVWLATTTLLGGTGAGVDGAAGGLAPGVAAVAAVFSTAATVLVTGAFHEDGLADVADGLGGTLDRERALAIMKDSRLGSFGVLALVLVVAAKLSLLAALAQRDPSSAVAAVMLTAHVVSRFAPLMLIRTLDYVEAGTRDTPLKAKPMASAIGDRALVVAGLWTLPALAWLAAVIGVPALACTIVAIALLTAMLGRWFRRRLGGFTGDCLGATQQGVELLVYLCACAAWGSIFA